MTKKRKSMLSKEQQLFVITMEECGELTQACSKMIRSEHHREKFREALKEEAGDVLCMIELMIELGYVTEEELAERVNTKRAKLAKWSNLFETR
jgi:NTP pyrophosphatase (non-canonical NTP hydrolase)